MREQNITEARQQIGSDPCVNTCNTARPPNAKELLCSAIGKIRNNLRKEEVRLDDLVTLLGLLPTEMTDRQSAAVYSLLLKNNI